MGADLQRGGGCKWQGIQVLYAGFAVEKERNFFLRVIGVIQISVLLIEENILRDNMGRDTENYLTTDFNSEKNRRSGRYMDFLRGNSEDIFTKLREGKALQVKY